MGVAVCRHRGGDIAATIVDFVFVFVFVFILFYVDGVMLSHLFPALPVAVAVVLGTVVPRVETKMVSKMMTVATMNEMHHGAPSTPPSNPCPREGKGKGNEGKGDEGKGGGHHHGKRW